MVSLTFRYSSNLVLLLCINKVGFYGYYDLNSKIHQVLTNVIPSNFRAGVTIPEIGLSGTLDIASLGGKKFATGTVSGILSGSYQQTLPLVVLML